MLFLGVGEDDGASAYTLSVNGIQIGSFKNELSKITFEEGIEFMYLTENIAIKKGDIITVVSQVGSADGKEWSRGRWGGVALIPQGEGKEALKALKEVGTVY